MRIVQTFWTAGQDPLKHSIGWLSPEHNLMSWALSCLSLRAHYNEVALYTDRQGYETLVKRLGLPYTETHVAYDESLCLPHHWAYAKIKTYAMQEKPFLHVDGDVYLPQPLPEDIGRAPLVAQNREVGTAYYKRMMDRILRVGTIKMPECVDAALRSGTLSSYNMGVFGGSDLAFIGRYCAEALHFVDSNRMNDPGVPHSRAWCNILFEQIIMAAMADSEGRAVRSVLGRDVEDEGYSAREFCNFESYERMPLFHVLGGHKRARSNCDMLEKTLLRLHEECYLRIVRLRQSEPTTPQAAGGGPATRYSMERSIAQYEDELERNTAEWGNLSEGELLETERKAAQYVRFRAATQEERQGFTVALHPRLHVFNVPCGWHPGALRLMRQKLGCAADYPLRAICMIPALLRRGTRETPVVDIQLQAISALRQGGKSYGALEDELLSGLTLRTEESKRGARRLILDEVTNIMRQGVLLANDNTHS